MKKYETCMRQLLLTLLAGIFLTPALSAQSLYGPCGTDSSTVRWELDAARGILLIGGEGKMKDFAPQEAPWLPLQKKIRMVAIGNKVTSIGKCAFAQCYVLEKVLFSASVESIGDSAFLSCHSLRGFNIGKGVREIAPSAFLSCLNLKKFIVEEGNENFSIINEALVDHTHARLIALPPTYEGDEYTAPGNISELGCGAFFACKNLKRIIIPTTVTDIQDGAFTLCHGLKEIQVQDNHPNFTVEDGILYNKKQTKVITCPAGRSKTTVKLPSTVTEIGALAFSDCHSIKKIQLPASVRKLGRNAFATCFALNDITLPEGITSIPDYAFGGCIGLTSISLPSTVTHIGKNAFEDCRALKKIAIPEAVEELPAYTFYSCEELRTVTLPPRLRTIGPHCFTTCSKLKELQLPATLERIGEAAFRECRALSQIDLPENLAAIGNSALAGCIGLKRLHIPQNIPSGIEKVFYDEKAISTVPDEQYSALANAFFCFSELKDITVDAGNPNYSTENGILYNKEKTRLIFAGGTRNNVRLPETVQEIAPYALYSVNLYKIHFPKSVKCFGSHSLPTLKEGGAVQGIHIYMHSPIPPALEGEQRVTQGEARRVTTQNGQVTHVSSKLFDLKTILHVPAGSKDKYENDSGWGKLFTGRIKDDIRPEEDGNSPETDDTDEWMSGIDILIRHTGKYKNPGKGSPQEINTVLEVTRAEGNATLQAQSEEKLRQTAECLMEEYNQKQVRTDVAASMMPYYKKAMTLEQLKEVTAAISTEQAQRAYELSQTSIQNNTNSTEMVLAIMALAAGETPAPPTPKPCTPAYRELAERYFQLLNLKGIIGTIIQNALPKEEGTDEAMSDFMDRYGAYFADNIETLMLNIYIGVLSEEDLRILCDIFQKPSGQAAMKAIQYMTEDPSTFASGMNEKLRTWTAQRIKEL